jgi:tRNA modification GTPase
LTVEDRQLLEWVRKQTAVVIVNKTDLPRQIDLNEVRELAGDLPLITTSLKEEHGIEDLEEAISELFKLGKVDMADGTYVSNARHIHLLKKALESVREVVQGIDAGMPLDMVEIDMKNAWQFLGEVIGDAVAEDLIDQIFSQFCLGK